MKIKILETGRYNNADRTAVDVEAGSEFETSTGYAEILIADGLAEYIEEPELPEEDDTKAKKTAKKPTVKKDKAAPASSVQPNPFVGS